jgi:pimeloyl-ACP methyl ester carboxylesterase
MDLLRVGLGDDQISYLGFSYGTYLGTFYADMFPSHVRASVLDGAIDPSLDIITLLQQQAVAIDAELTTFLQDCVSHACPFASDAKGAAATLDALLAQLDSRPLPVGSRTVGRSEALTALIAGLVDPSGWGELALAIAAARTGDGSKLLNLNDSYTERHPDGTYDNVFEAFTAVDCLDRPSPTRVEDYDKAAAEAAKVAPHFGEASINGLMPCAFWPVPPKRWPPSWSAPCC